MFCYELAGSLLELDKRTTVSEVTKHIRLSSLPAQVTAPQLWAWLPSSSHSHRGTVPTRVHSLGDYPHPARKPKENSLAALPNRLGFTGKGRSLARAQPLQPSL